MTSPIEPTGTSAAVSSPSVSAATQPSLTQSKDMFLKLLVAQLRYQDPTKPADTGQFLAQTAQFTMVERIEELAKGNADLLAAQRAASATALVGRQVSYTASDGTPATGTVTAARLESSGPVLEGGGQSVPLSSVTAVTAAPTTTPTTATSS